MKILIIRRDYDKNRRIVNKLSTICLTGINLDEFLGFCRKDVERCKNYCEEYLNFKYINNQHIIFKLKRIYDNSIIKYRTVSYKIVEL